MNSTPMRLSTADATLLVIDFQDKLLSAISGGQAAVAGAVRMVEAGKILGVPLLLTEQYPAGLGPTCAAVRSAVGEFPAISKLRFSACVEEVTSRLDASGRRQVIVVGIETHVCVQQTVLDLLRAGHGVWVCADAVGSRRTLDHETSLARMRQAGAVVSTTESAIFEMLEQAGTEQFKRVLKIVK